MCRILSAALFIVVMLAACGSRGQPASTPTPSPVPPSPTVASTSTTAPTATATPAPTATPLPPTATFTAAPSSPTPVPPKPTAVPTPSVIIRLSAGKYGKPLWLEVLAGELKLTNGTTLLAGSAIGVQEDWLAFSRGMLIQIGSGPVVFKGKNQEQGTSFTVDATGNLQPTVSSAAPADSAADAVTPHATVKAASLNVRTGPGTAYAVTTAARQGDVLPVIGQTGACAWLKVTVPTGEGWVIGGAEYVTLDVPCSTVPAAAVPPTPVPPPPAAAAPAPTVVDLSNALSITHIFVGGGKIG